MVGLLALVLATATVVGTHVETPVGTGVFVLIGAAAFALAAYVVWHVPPAYSVTGSLLLAVFGSHWDALGLPGKFAPDRLLLALTVLAVLLRAPCMRDRPVIAFRPLQVLMALTAAWGLASAFGAGNLFQIEGFTNLVDRLGLLAFTVFIIAPAVFVTQRDRDVLLVALIAMGAYLGLTALFETLGLGALVFPRYISDPNVGIHFGRARGPFVQAAINGLAMYASLGACVIAAIQWRDRGWRRYVPLVVSVLLVTGLVFTLQRSIWLGTVVATVTMMLAVSRLRPWLIPAVVGATLAVLIILAVVPGFATRATERRDASGTIAGRRALNDAAVNMFQARPLLGFGWGTFRTANADYFEISDAYSLRLNKNLPLHNVFLANLVEIGLVGTVLWLLTLLGGVGGAILTRGPPEIDAWRVALAALFIVWLVVATASPLTGSFQSLVIWTFAAVIVASRESDGVRSP